VRPFHKSLRWRLQAWHSIILLTVLVAFGGTAYWLVRENSFKRIDTELQRRLMVVASGIGPPLPGDMRSPPWEPGFRLQRGHRALFEEGGSVSYYYRVMSSTGKVIASSSNAPADIPVSTVKPTSGDPVVRQRGDFRELMLVSTRPLPHGFMEQKDPPKDTAPPFRSLAFLMAERLSSPSSWWFHAPFDMETLRKSLPQAMVVVGCSMAPVQAELHHLAWGLSLAGVAVVFLGLVTGCHFSAHAIKPIDSIRHAATVVAGGDLAARIRIEDATSELGELAGVLNDTFDRLQSAFARQAQFTADASHELRTPTFVILLQAQAALKRDRTAAEYREALGVCQASAQQMRYLVESLLMLARQDGSASEIHREPCAVDEIVREAVTLLRGFAEARHIPLHLELKPAVAIADTKALKQVITNLVVNAIEYNQPGGEVKVTVTQRAEGVVLIVRDTGVGISSRDLPHVFDRFYRADNARSSADGHTGLGLSICKAIVESHRGNITVESEPGKGTTFSVVVPLFAEASTRSVPYAITPSITFP
jgi:two-component system OmpR family sensor kinase